MVKLQFILSLCLLMDRKWTTHLEKAARGGGGSVNLPDPPWLQACSSHYMYCKFLCVHFIHWLLVFVANVILVTMTKFTNMTDFHTSATVALTTIPFLTLAVVNMKLLLLCLLIQKFCLQK